MTEEEIEILEDMLTALVDLVIERGVITQDEYDRKVEERLGLSKELTHFDELGE
jgi:hypothetical protein